MKSFKDYIKKPIVADNPFLDWKSSFGEIRKNKKLPENPFLDWKSSFGEIRKNKKLPDNPFLDWKSSFGEIRKKSIKEEIEERLKHVGNKVGPMISTVDDDRYDEIHEHPDIKSRTGFNDDERKSIFDYSEASKWDSERGHASSSNMNEYLRHRMGNFASKIIGDHAEEKVKSSIAKLRTIFRPEHTNRKPIETYTGVPQHVGEKLNNMEPGQHTHFPGFTSSSTHIGVGASFAEGFYNQNFGSPPPHVIKFHVHPGAGVSIAPHSYYKAEDEILLNHGSKVVHTGKRTRMNIGGVDCIVHHMEVHPETMSLDQYPHEYDPTRK